MFLGADVGNFLACGLSCGCGAFHNPASSCTRELLTDVSHCHLEQYVHCRAIGSSIECCHVSNYSPRALSLALIRVKFDRYYQI